MRKEGAREEPPTEPPVPVERLYFDQLKRYPPLEKEETNRLIGIIKDESASLEKIGEKQEAIKRLIEHNLRYVASFVKKCRKQGRFLLFPEEELIAEGNLFLVENMEHIVEKFDLGREILFSTYL